MNFAAKQSKRQWRDSNQPGATPLGGGIAEMSAIAKGDFQAEWRKDKIRAAQQHSPTFYCNERTFYCNEFSAAAFTLIEILIAVAIFAIVLAAINGIFYSSLHLQMKTSSAIEEMLPADHAATLIKRDIANIVTPGVMAQSVSGGLGSKAPVSAGLGLNSPVSLELYTSGGILTDDAPWGDIQKVDYSLQDSADRRRGKDLVRSVSHNLLSTAIETPEQQRLLENVDKLKVSFFDGTNWVDVWGTADTISSTNPPVPAAIRVEITQFEDGQSAKYPIDLLVPVMAAYPVSTNQ